MDDFVSHVKANGSLHSNHSLLSRHYKPLSFITLTSLLWKNYMPYILSVYNCKSQYLKPEKPVERPHATASNSPKLICYNVHCHNLFTGQLLIGTQSHTALCSYSPTTSILWTPPNHWVCSVFFLLLFRFWCAGEHEWVIAPLTGLLVHHFT
jgi:hypothetical protein